MNYILKIKDLLKKNNLTQRDFSKKIGVSLTTTNSYLTGKTKIDIETFIKIADVLGVSVGYFFDEKTDYDKNTAFYKVVKKFFEFEYIKYKALRSALEKINKKSFIPEKEKVKRAKEMLFDEFWNFIILDFEELDFLRKENFISLDFYNIIVGVKKEKDKE